MLPILVAVAFGASQLLAAGIAGELSDHAAQAGAMAMLQGGDPRAAARGAVPGWARDGLDVEVDEGRARVRVELRPPLAFPPLADELTAHATAHAGDGGS